MQVFVVCRPPTSPALLFPQFNSSGVFNKAVVLSWEEITNTMIGSPCSPSISGVPLVNVYLNSAQQLISNLPHSIITNLSTAATETASFGSYQKSNSFIFFRFRTEHYLFLANYFDKW